MAIIRWIFQGIRWVYELIRRGFNHVVESWDSWGVAFFGGFAGSLTWLAQSLFGHVLSRLWDALTFYTGLQGVSEVIENGGIAVFIINDCARIPVALTWVLALVSLWSVLRLILLAKAGITAALHVIP